MTGAVICDERGNEIRRRAQEVDSEILELAIARLDRALDAEMDRWRDLEGKASTVVSVSSVVISVMFGVVVTIQPEASAWPSWLLIGAIVFVIVALLLALGAMRVGAHRFMEERSATVIDAPDLSVVGYRRELLGDLLMQYEHNSIVVNHKAAYVIGSQQWLRNSVIFLGVASMVAIGPWEFAPARHLSEAACRAGACRATRIDIPALSR